MAVVIRGHWECKCLWCYAKTRQKLHVLVTDKERFFEQRWVRFRWDWLSLDTCITVCTLSKLKSITNVETSNLYRTLLSCFVVPYTNLTTQVRAFIFPMTTLDPSSLDPRGQGQFYQLNFDWLGSRVWWKIGWIMDVADADQMQTYKVFHLIS